MDAFYKEEILVLQGKYHLPAAFIACTYKPSDLFIEKNCGLSVEIK